LARLYQRYRLAVEHSRGKRVLEVACGSGVGLGYLAQSAVRVVGGDYTESLLHMSRDHYRERVPLVRLDAQVLPFRNGSFDTVVLFEAIYYLPDGERFFAESRRVLVDGGTLLIGMVNKEWPEFSPSSFSTRYFSATELHAMLTRQGFAPIEFFGGFPASIGSPRQMVIALIRRVAATLHLIPKTLGARARLKRLFYGATMPLPAEVREGMTEFSPLEQVDGHVSNTLHKIIYTVARASKSGTGPR
jgi:SAM-dependent methyltransferase